MKKFSITLCLMLYAYVIFSQVYTASLTSFSHSLGDCNSTWTYEICRDPGVNAISHVTFEFCQHVCVFDPNDNTNAMGFTIVNDDCGWTLIEAGPDNSDSNDPSICGMKYADTDNEFECCEITFTIAGVPNVVTDAMYIYMKGGGNNNVYTNVDGPDPNYTDCDCTSQSVPIELSSFTVESKEGVHTLNWRSEIEVNFSHFEIEHSMDGYSFANIGKISSDDSRNYRFNYIPDAGDNFYRLKMVDLDGSYEYSKIIKGYCDYDIFNNPSLMDKFEFYNLNGNRINPKGELPVGIYIIKYQDAIRKVFIGG